MRPVWFGERLHFVSVELEVKSLHRVVEVGELAVGRVRDGTAANADAAVMEAQVRPLAEAAWRFARRAGGA